MPPYKIVTMFQFLGVLAIFVSISIAQDFDKNTVGVAFSPYVQQLPAKNWDQYTTDEIKQMLNVVSAKFSSISTYSMGTASYNADKSWDQADANCRVARAAAQLNQDNGNQVVSINQGVYQGATIATEITNAFSAAEDANGIFGGTVWGITFTNEYITDTNSGNEVLSMITNNKAQAQSQGLKVGTRVNVCGQIVNDAGLQNTLQQIAQASDFIYCNLYPADGSTDPNQAAQDVGASFLSIQQAFQAVNPSLSVQIGETGWPSDGNSFDNTPNSVGNLVSYWNAFGQWAAQNSVKVQMFEAIDEPWKTASQWSGEGHYGWWTMPDNNNVQYVEKASI